MLNLVSIHLAEFTSHDYQVVIDARFLHVIVEPGKAVLCSIVYDYQNVEIYPARLHTSSDDGGGMELFTHCAKARQDVNGISYRYKHKACALRKPASASVVRSGNSRSPP